VIEKRSERKETAVDSLWMRRKRYPIARLSEDECATTLNHEFEALYV